MARPERAYVVSTNLHRRHLTESQRGIVATRIANMPNHRPEKGANLHPSADAASLLNVSERTVKAARTVQRDAVPELSAAVDRGDVAVSTAADVAKLPQAEQSAIVAKAGMRFLATRDVQSKTDKKRRVGLLNWLVPIGAIVLVFATTIFALFFWKEPEA